MGLDSKVDVSTLRTDLHYWPTLELRRSVDGDWKITLHAGQSGEVADAGLVGGLGTGAPAPPGGCGEGVAGDGCTDGGEM